MKKVMVLVLVLLLGLTATVVSEKRVEDIVIGATFQGLSDEYIVRLSDAFIAKAEEMGVKIIVSDGQMNAEKQVGQVENFVAQKVDVIVMNPITADGCAPAVIAANEAGIPIITTCTQTTNQADALCFVGSDSYQSGVMEAEMVLEDFPNGADIVVMYGVMGSEGQIARKAGMMDTFAGKNINIVAEQTGNWSREEGMNLMENWLSSGKKIDAVVAQNDAMALGAVMAIEAKGLTGTIKVYGIDAQAEALVAVEKGTMAGTVFQNAESQGANALLVALDIAQGKTVDPVFGIPYEPVRQADAPHYKELLGIK